MSYYQHYGYVYSIGLFLLTAAALYYLLTGQGGKIHVAKLRMNVETLDVFIVLLTLRGLSQKKIIDNYSMGVLFFHTKPDPPFDKFSFRGDFY